MLTHYCKIAFRNLWKYKTQSLTGIFGLAFAIACFVPALYWLRYETSYDSFYPGSEHIYRVYSVDKQSGKVNELVSGILNRKLSEQYAAIESSTVFFIEQNNCSAEGTPHIRLRTLFSDSTFFSVFPQVMAGGDIQRPFQVTNDMVLTETVAVRLFGDTERAIGQQIKSTLFPYDSPYTVTAVVKDPLPNTNLSFDAILFHEQIRQHKSFVENSTEQVWTFATLQMYARLHPHTDIDGFTGLLRDFPLQLDKNTHMELRMLPVSDIRHRLNADVPFTLNFIGLFVASGILLLLSAIFNFLNLQLDLFRQRSREMRQRTAHGAKSRQLVLQMLFELACSILLALSLACCFVVIVRPAFSGLLDIEMGMQQLMALFAVCGTGMMVLMLFIGFILFRRLSRLALQPLSKGKTTGQPVLRRMAVTLQLAVSVVFIVAALVVMKQMHFVNHKDLGLNSNGVIRLDGLSFFTDRDMLTVLMNELSSVPQIKSISDAYFEIQHSANSSQMKTEVEWPGKPPSEKPAFHLIATNSRFAETFGLNMLQGEWFDELGEDKIVLNEEAVRVMGLSDPVGALIRMDLNSVKECKVVGVVKDFHTLSLRSRILPTIFIKTYPAASFYIRTIPGQEREVIQRINAILPEIDASLAEVHPVLLNELYDRLNYSEQAGLRLFSILATVCLLISLFGIYAVATTSTQRRRKEIAIHKVMGAEAGDIIHIFFREYTLQVIIAGAVALPLAYLAMSRWLQGYAYRTNIPWWLLAGVLTGVVAVVLLTVLGQVVKAARSNPAEVIKSE